MQIALLPVGEKVDVNCNKVNALNVLVTFKNRVIVIFMGYEQKGLFN